jgi:hypothetical protein
MRKEERRQKEKKGRKERRKSYLSQHALNR